MCRLNTRKIAWQWETSSLDKGLLLQLSRSVVFVLEKNSNFNNKSWWDTISKEVWKEEDAKFYDFWLFEWSLYRSGNELNERNLKWLL